MLVQRDNNEKTG